MELVNQIIEKSTELVASGGLLFGFLMVLTEAFIPILPLGGFVSLNINAFGFFIGVVISWLATCLGSYIAFIFFNLLETKLLYKLIKSKTAKKIETQIHKFNKIKFQSLVLILTLPFTPSCLINLLAGVSSMSKEKYLSAILIGKAFMITFWGYIGKSFIESLTDIKALIYIGIILLLSYVISKVVSKKMNIE